MGAHDPGRVCGRGTGGRSCPYGKPTWKGLSPSREAATSGQAHQIAKSRQGHILLCHLIYEDYDLFSQRESACLHPPHPIVTHWRYHSIMLTRHAPFSHSCLRMLYLSSWLLEKTDGLYYRHSYPPEKKRPVIFTKSIRLPGFERLQKTDTRFRSA